MDTNLGAISLTEKQISNLPSLVGGNIKGFSYWEASGEVVVVSETPVDVAQTRLLVEGLPDAYSQDELVRRFDPEVAIGREAQVFGASDLIRLMPYSYTLNELIKFKNFWGGVANGVPYAGLKQVGQGLVGAGLILQSDYDKLASILLEQGVVL
jgi:hypothetical protein